MKIRIYIFFGCIMFSSCRKKYEATRRICDKKMYMEIFNINPAGVDAEYLTDSLSFRLYVGKYDSEHEGFFYSCVGDSVKIEKMAIVDTTSVMKVIQTRYYSILKLKNEKIFE